MIQGAANEGTRFVQTSQKFMVHGQTLNLIFLVSV